MIDILDFSDLVHRSARGLRLLGMLRAYFDETGSDGDKEGVFGIVGLIAPTSVWRRTQIEWEHALGCFGVSEFHAVDVENCRKEFDGWTSQQREKLVGAL
ncbi:MAG TPA: hypothetical protein VGR96_14460, partial [Acidobacteriaceae bacterium]|nr:hypothetical protein [Acidobacteriaceae bacterium]